MDTRPSYLVGLVGKSILRSKSPAMHQREADALGIRCVYRLIDLSVLNLGLEDLPRVLDSAELMGFDGLNITHPYKQAVIPLLHELSEDARAIGCRTLDGGGGWLSIKHVLLSKSSRVRRRMVSGCRVTLTALPGADPGVRGGVAQTGIVGHAEIGSA